MIRPPLAEALDLQPHPEGGWFRETFRSRHAFQPAGYEGSRTAATAIYYLLEPGDHSRWHVVASDELWLWHRGGPVEIKLGGNGEEPDAQETIVLGPLVEEDQVPQFMVPAHHWQSATPASEDAVLVSCVVAPGFEFADFRLGP